jgi:cation transport ATPase
VSTAEHHPGSHRGNGAGHQQQESKQHPDETHGGKDGQGSEGGHGSSRMYLKFALILLVSLALMWVLSMSMVRSIDHFYFNLSNFWMALLMVSAMAIVMTAGMWSMFKNRKANIALLVGFAVLFGAVFALGRTETFVGNEQFLKSMIPHHSRALLVCQESDITDPEIIELCDSIVKSQQEEITQMQAILDRYASDESSRK